MSGIDDEKVRQLLAMVGSGLDSANMAFALLAEYLNPTEVELIESDDPELCQHPRELPLETAGGITRMCASCGTIL